jgi:hypothetical protein
MMSMGMVTGMATSTEVHGIPLHMSWSDKQCSQLCFRLEQQTATRLVYQHFC